MRRLPPALAVGTVTFALIALLQGAGLLDRLELLTLDARYGSGIGRRPAGSDIVVAWIDQESMDYVERHGASFPWPRSVHEQALRYVLEAGARAVVFDVLFDQMGNADDDRGFGTALSGKPCVLAMKFMASRRGGRNDEETAALASRGLPWSGPLPERQPENGFVLPTPDVLAGASRLGFVNIRPDADKVYRHYDLVRLWTPPGGAPTVQPSLALAAVVAAGHADDAGAITRLALPAGSADGRVLLNFRGPEFTFEHVKFVNILESLNRIDAGEAPLYPPERFRDKIVLVGINAEGYEDVHPTPLSRVFPGVELHATAIDNLLRQDLLRAPAWELPLAAAAIAATTTTVFACPGVFSALAILSALAAAALASVLVAWLQLLAIPVAAPALGAIGSAGAGFLWRLVVEGRQKRELRRAFTSYLAPEVLAEVLRNPQGLALGGEQRTVTLLFTDLQGFTGLAEHTTPTELVGFLNDYFTRMCAPILEQRGVIDKFIGDAIMAMFGAPLPSDGHGAAAVRAALRMQATSASIAAELRRRGQPEIVTRIGVHTGSAVVGNMGSASRFDYTAIGDTVNLAARLEGANKAFGTTCLVSEATWATVPGDVAGREVGLVAVKGRVAPIRVFTPLGLRNELDAAARELVDRHAAALAALRAGDRTRANSGFAELLRAAPGDALAERYLAHLVDPGWDGVFHLDSK